MRLRKVFGGRDAQYLELFERASANVVACADALERMLAEWPDSVALGDTIKDLEHEGDRITQSISRGVNRTRGGGPGGSDLIDLAHALDDIADHAEEAADLLGLYRIEAPTEQAVQLAGILHAATRHLAVAVSDLRSGRLSESVADVHRMEKEGDRVSREAVAALFETGIDPMTVIRWKDVYERLEDAIDATEHAADLLDGIVAQSG